MLLSPAVADAIHASPDDLAPRRALAAQLAASGEADKARFIETQCALSGGDGDGPEGRAMRHEQARLWAEHRDAWCGELGISPPEATFDRGVLAGLHCTVDQLIELAPRVFTHSAVDALTLRLHPCDPIEALTRCGALTRVRHLTIKVETTLDDETGYPRALDVGPQLAALLGAPIWPSLRSLTIDDQRQTPAAFIDHLAGLSELRTLRLTSQELTEEDALRLASYPWVRQLEALDLQGTGLTDEGLRALVTASGGALRDLSLGHGTIGLEALEQACGALRLAGLTLVRAGLDPQDLARLLRGPALAGLARLDLSQNPLDEEIIGAICGLAALRRLTLGSCELNGEPLVRALDQASPLPWRSLTLHGSDIGEDGAAALSLLSMPQLTELSLSWTNIGDGVIALASATLPSLRCLDLSGNSLSRAGAEAIASCSSWPSLVALSVGQRQTHFDELAALLAWPGLASLRRLSLTGDTLDEGLALAIASCERLGALEELCLTFGRLEEEAALPLASEPALASLRSIELHPQSPNLAFIDALRGRPGLLRLHATESLSEGHYKNDSLALSRDGLNDPPVDLCFDKRSLTDDDLEALFRSKNLAALEALVLGWHGFGERGAMALAGATHLRRLRELCLAGNPIGDRAVEALFGAPAGARLQCVNLRDCGLTDDALRAIAAAPGAGRLRRLYLCKNALTGAGLGELASAPSLAGLEILHLAHTPLGPAGASQLFERARLPALRMLNMQETGVDDDALLVLARNPCLASLEYLRLPGNPIEGPGIEALVQGGRLDQLDSLNLRDCRLDDRAILAIADSPHLGQLRYLALDDNQITDQGALALAQSKKLPSLESLSLSGNRVESEGKKALKRRGVNHSV